MQHLLAKSPLAIAVASLVLAAPSALASSHREAPFITGSPKVDGTDFYMFRSYEPTRSDFVTLIANYQPLQDASERYMRNHMDLNILESQQRFPRGG